jgi:hypothetical protein
MGKLIFAQVDSRFNLLPCDAAGNGSLGNCTDFTTHHQPDGAGALW